jgi:hypothetical protein
MTSKATVRSTVIQRLLNRDLPFAQPLATDPSTVTYRSVNRDTYRSVNRCCTVEKPSQVDIQVEHTFQVEFLGWCSGCSSASIAASSAPLARELEAQVMYV